MRKIWNALRLVLRRLDEIDIFSALNKQRARVHLSLRRQAAPGTQRQETGRAFVFPHAFANQMRGLSKVFNNNLSTYRHYATKSLYKVFYCCCQTVKSHK